MTQAVLTKSQRLCAAVRVDCPAPCKTGWSHASTTPAGSHAAAPGVLRQPLTSAAQQGQQQARTWFSTTSGNSSGSIGDGSSQQSRTWSMWLNQTMQASYTYTTYAYSTQRPPIAPPAASAGSSSQTQQRQRQPPPPPQQQQQQVAAAAGKANGGSSGVGTPAVMVRLLSAEDAFAPVISAVLARCPPATAGAPAGSSPRATAGSGKGQRTPFGSSSSNGSSGTTVVLMGHHQWQQWPGQWEQQQE